MSDVNREPCLNCHAPHGPPAHTNPEGYCRNSTRQWDQENARLEDERKGARASLLRKLAAAVENDHPCDDLQGCDIALALSEGHVAWAAHLLTGATECEETEALYVQFTATFTSDDELQAHLRAECDALCKLPHWTCDKCNSVQWADPDDESQCTNCLHPHQGKPESEDA